MQYHVYNTGDQIWTSQKFGQRVTVKMITHDGKVWEEGDTVPFRRITGAEKYIHTAQTFLVKLLLSILG